MDIAATARVSEGINKGLADVQQLHYETNEVSLSIIHATGFVMRWYFGNEFVYLLRVYC